MELDCILSVNENLGCLLENSGEQTKTSKHSRRVGEKVVEKATAVYVVKLYL